MVCDISEELGLHRQDRSPGPTVSIQRVHSVIIAIDSTQRTLSPYRSALDQYGPSLILHVVDQWYD